jgi:hypothetical protein
MLSDAQQNNNKVIVTYDVETGQKEVVHRPSNSQSLTFNTVEVIARDTESQNVGANTLPSGKTNLPCSSSVTITLLSGCFS